MGVTDGCCWRAIGRVGGYFLTRPAAKSTAGAISDTFGFERGFHVTWTNEAPWSYCVTNMITSITQGQNVVVFSTHRKWCSTQHVFSIFVATILAYLCVHRKDIKNMMLTPKYLKVKSWSLSTSTSKRGRSNDPVAASNIFESKEHTSSLFAKIWNPKKTRLLLDLLSNLNRTLGQKPPRTPGAFLHVGKTGEADLSFVVAVACCCCYCSWCCHAQTTSTRQVKLTGMPFSVFYLRRRHPSFAFILSLHRR